MIYELEELTPKLLNFIVKDDFENIVILVKRLNELYFLFNDFNRISAVIKIEGQEDYRYLVNKEMLSNFLEAKELIGDICRAVYDVFERLDNIKMFMNFM